MKWYKDKPKHQTNFDRVARSPEALAEFMKEHVYYPCDICSKKRICGNDECILQNNGTEKAEWVSVVKTGEYE